MNPLQIQNFLRGKKTYLICLSSLVAVLIGWTDGTLNNQTAIQQAVGLILAATIRSGITTAVESAYPPTARKLTPIANHPRWQSVETIRVEEEIIEPTSGRGEQVD